MERRVKGMMRNGLSVRAILILCCVLAAYLALLLIEEAHDPAWTHRWLSDDSDRNVYFERAQFLPGRTVPYLDVPSEYPTLATLAFAAPFLVSPGPQLTREAYWFRWSLLMAIVLAAIVFLVARFRVRYGLSPDLALLLLLPSPLYFSLMRFDILCAFLVCVSLAAFCRGRYGTAHALLGIAIFVKWYPAIVFPVYAAFHLSREPAVRISLRQILRTNTVRFCGIFFATVMGIVVASIVAFTWDGFLVPYQFHADRGGQYFNLYWLLEQASLGIDPSGWRWVNAAFLALQLSIVPILLFRRIESRADVFRYSILGIYLFITFARIDSPQWILWYLPAALMVASDARTVAALAALSILNYAVFPVAYDAYDHGLAPAFSLIVFLKDVVLVALIRLLFRDAGLERLDEHGLSEPRVRSQGVPADAAPLVEAGDAAAAAGAGQVSERTQEVGYRRFDRLPVAVPVGGRAALFRETELWGTVRNVSGGGLMAEFPVQIVLESRVSLVLHTRRGPLPVTGHVVWAGPPRGAIGHGIAFSEPKGHDFAVDLVRSESR